MMYIVEFLGIFLLLALLRVPIAFGMGIAAVALFFLADIPIASVPMALFSGLDSFTFLAIPAFIFAGDLMGASGISTRIVAFAKSFIGRCRGAVGSIAVVTSLFFGTLTGSSLATVTAICGMMMPEMERAGYRKEYSAALIACCGFLGILIPPSIPGIVYAMMSGESLMKIWICTIVPGILIALVYIGIHFFRYGRKEQKCVEPFRFVPYAKGIGAATNDSILALLMPIIIFCGIYGGIFTPTEAGGVAVFYGLIAGWMLMPVVYKSKPDKPLLKLISDSAMSSASVCLIIAFAGIAGKAITFSRIPGYLTEALLSVTDSKIVFLLLLNIMLIFVGMFLETNTSILILGPILIPVAKAYGVDPIHFASIMLLNLEIGMITPPMAGNLFVACRMSEKSIDEVVPDVLPFLIGAACVLLVITYVPQLVLFLPNLI